MKVHVSRSVSLCLSVSPPVSFLSCSPFYPPPPPLGGWFSTLSTFLFFLFICPPLWGNSPRVSDYRRLAQSSRSTVVNCIQTFFLFSVLRIRWLRQPSSDTYANPRLIFPIWLARKNKEESRTTIVRTMYVRKDKLEKFKFCFQNTCLLIIDVTYHVELINKLYKV